MSEQGAMDLCETMFKDDTRYAYAVGRIRALETKLLTRAEFGRLLDAADYHQTLRLLAELGYSIAEGTSEYEPVLLAGLGETLNLLEQLSEDEGLADLFRRRYDYHNLKVLLKGKHSRQELEHAVIDLGLVTLDGLAEAVMQDEPGKLPAPLAAAMSAAERAFAERQAPQDLDIAIDKEHYRSLAEALDRLGNPFLRRWLTLEVDMVNIKSFLRLRWLEESTKYLERDMLPGGTLGVDFFRAIKEESIDTLPQAFQRTPYGKAISGGIAQLKGQQSFAQLERGGDELLIQFLKTSRETSFGIEPVVAYVLLKEFEIKGVRAILVGKLNDLPREKIKERLPSEFV